MHPVVQIRNLSYTYPGGTPALQGISLVIAEKENIALLGANGAGKSTLLLHFNGILQGQGECFIFGLPLIKKYLPEIRSHVGLVMQNPDDMLFLPTVRENVAFGLLNQGLSRKTVEYQVEEALIRTGIPHLADRFPYHLSLGEKKRAALACVLASKPELLILDEPSAGLDPGGRLELLELLRSLPMTKLIATHDLELAWLLSERTLLLKKGQLAGNGPTQEIFHSPAFLDALQLPAPPCFLQCRAPGQWTSTFRLPKSSK